ncbi:hypothetical protein GCM10011583_45650 [Streptomyces camponoticapitis]|uniref:Uncharacterized protein n=1 Tax=Streptomyces camponoticapitis TaxID=1616125 RepID=A0ABQ2EHN8_9ACTN|nr:hypothetical protein [Streptomyces camponoticapitis]GGK08537.1 hypothetical protein GCM10011583_45650 [Streptomyces camponoticapitis]
MLTETANGNSRLSFWPRVREFAVPPSMIETATARRQAGDWAGACAAARIDVDLSPRSSARTHGRELTARLRADLRHLAPDLLRWHMPRIAPDGLLRPGLTVALARYGDGLSAVGPVYLVARTPPAWADAGQRISLALWDGSHAGAAARRHPHPHPDRRFRLDLHRHLWDARRTDELRARSGADSPSGGGGPVLDPAVPEALREALPDATARRCAVDRWAAEAGILLRAEGRSTGAVAVRLGARLRLELELVADEHGAGPPVLRIAEPGRAGPAPAPPLLPDAATWILPDLELIRAGAIDVDRLHPLVAPALVPGCSPTGPAPVRERSGQPRLVDCRGARHRIGLVDGVLSALDHDPDEIRREELLAALTGTPLACLRAIDEAHRSPDCLTGVRERLDHGDAAGALAVVEGLLGPDALLRGGALRDELEAAAERRVSYGLFRAGMVGPGPGSGRNLPRNRRPRDLRSHPRVASTR